MADKTKEPQYQDCLDYREKYGLTTLGLMSNQYWRDDPRRLVFVTARYKFVSKMLSGCKNVLEVGCADAFATRIVLQEVDKLTAVDFDPIFIQDVNNRMDPDWKFEAKVHDILEAPVDGQFDGIYAMDVMEHIQPDKEETLLKNMVSSLAKNGCMIVGIPSLESQTYASPPSKAGHVNCQNGEQFKKTMRRYFHNVFVFSMNDEVVHTGYYPMAQYLLALCCNKRD